MSNEHDETLSETAGPNTAHPGSERARDEQRDEAGPQYGGGTWQEADGRGDDRFGSAPNDDADPSELAAGEAANDQDEAPKAADSDVADAEEAGDNETEDGGQHAGMGRGEKPQQSKPDEK